MTDLKQYLEMTTMMVLATKDSEGNPYTANVYFGYNPDNYSCYFISRLTREHSKQIIENEAIAWSIINTQQSWPRDSDKKWLQFQWIARVLEWDESRQIFEEFYLPRINFQGLPEWHHVFECKPTQVKIWDENLYGGDGKLIKF